MLVHNNKAFQDPPMHLALSRASRKQYVIYNKLQISELVHYYECIDIDDACTLGKKRKQETSVNQIYKPVQTLIFSQRDYEAATRSFEISSRDRQKSSTVMTYATCFNN